MLYLKIVYLNLLIIIIKDIISIRISTKLNDKSQIIYISNFYKNNKIISMIINSMNKYNINRININRISEEKIFKSSSL